MDDVKEKIELFIKQSKKKSKLNKSEIAEVIAILYELLNKDNNSISYVVNALVELHYTVTAIFFENIFPALTDQEKKEFINSFLHNDKIQKNAGSFGVNRNLIIVNALLQASGNDEYVHTVLQFSSKQASGKDGGKKAGELLLKNCFENTKDKLLLLDYLTWQESDLQSLVAWIGNAVDKTSDDKVITAYNAFLEKYNLPIRKKPESQNNKVQPYDEEISNLNQKETRANEKIKHPKAKIVGLVNDLNSEISKIVNEHMKLILDIEQLKAQLTQANKEKVDLSIRLTDELNKNEQLQTENRVKEQKIYNAEKQVAEMDERLRNAFNADLIQQNYELISLKNELAKGLELEYEDYKKLAQKQPGEYHIYYEGLIGIIDSIFDTLRRKGIKVG